MRRSATLFAGISLLAGCGGESPPTVAGVRVEARVESERGTGENVARELAALRRATEKFQDFHKAVAAGWSAKITACMTSAEGGMGFHYGNTALIDSTVRVRRPELLLYEPQHNGRLRLVAVEYIIPYQFHSRDSAPPMLFGQPFKPNDTFQLWGLHAWVWKENPRGVFADWNPRVNCDNTTDVMPM
jgi:hypothetical protein